MKNLSFLFLLSMICLAASCEDDEAPLGPTGTVNLNWTGVYEDEPLVMLNEIYKYPDGQQVYFKDVEFFVSEIFLVEESGDEVELIDVEYVNFSGNGTEAEAMEPLVFSKNLIPAGNYKSIRIGFGVPSDLNNEDANQFGEGHPLRKNFGQFWRDWDSFIFTMINGQYDENGDGIFDGNDIVIGHHLGSDPVFRSVTFERPLEVVEGQTLELNVVFDLKKLYARSDSDYFDMTAPGNNHTNDPNDLSVADYLVANFQQAVTVE